MFWIAFAIIGVIGIGAHPCVLSQIMSNSGLACAWQVWHEPPKRLTTSVAPRTWMAEPLGETSSSKYSQSLVAGLKPASRFTIASVGTSCTSDPTG